MISGEPARLGYTLALMNAPQALPPVTCKPPTQRSARAHPGGPSRPGWRAPCALFATLGLCLVASSVPVSTRAAPQLRAILTEEQALQRAETDAQARVDALADQTESLLSEYRAILDQADSLDAYNRQLATMVAAQEARLASFDQRLASAEETQRNVAPLLERMLGVLERFVAADLPFLEQERTDRLASLRQVLEDPAQGISERFRRVLEAYQVELDYGRTIEAWRGQADLGGGEQVVDLLRIGRLALFCTTLDGGTAARWDPGHAGWRTLPGHALPQVQRALKVARKELPPELLILPVAAP